MISFCQNGTSNGDSQNGTSNGARRQPAVCANWFPRRILPSTLCTLVSPARERLPHHPTRRGSRIGTDRR
jgi:hypothetical protein